MGEPLFLGVGIDAVDACCLAHLVDQVGEHGLSGAGLAREVFHDSPFAFRQYHVNGDWALLAKPPAAPDRLVVLLEAV
ncbi:MAG: hypothetical protein EBV32_04375 [Proteobacteria bacterium]|uniref:Uncharacterized protein n=1 Tax=Candidatus Fonsibacter lacus TaxID=2576439 RepID=A0A964XS75_9PROT|nr:hypothetical protein [Candidatus Fonsibacter lacus]